jgi:hypothetical protein
MEKPAMLHFDGIELACIFDLLVPRPINLLSNVVCPIGVVEFCHRRTELLLAPGKSPHRVRGASWAVSGFSTQSR